MKALRLGCCALLWAIVGMAQTPDAVVAGMAAKYDAKLKEIGQVRDKAAQEVLTELKALLESLDKKYAAQGNLNGVLAVRKTRETLVSPDVQIPDDAIPASGALSEILKRHGQKRGQIEETHLNSRLDLMRAYLTALERMKVGFTKQSKIDEAMTVSVEIERVTELEPDLVAKVRGEGVAAPVSTGPPPPPQKPAGPMPGEPWTSPTGIEFVYIPPGAFMMGSPADEKGRNANETQHRVSLTKGYFLAKYEVTQAQWEAVMGSNPSGFKGADLPVETVSWGDCQEFIRKLCEKEGAPPGTYRFPTEAEWEYACRAGTTGPHAGDLDDMAWYGNNSGDKRMDAQELWGADPDWARYTVKMRANGCATHPVGQKKPNAWGLYDMHGNVCEWCQDWKGDYPTGGVTDPTGPGSSSLLVNRGGSWRNDAGHCRSAIRNSFGLGSRDPNLGFRLVRADSSIPKAQ